MMTKHAFLLFFTCLTAAGSVYSQTKPVVVQVPKPISLEQDLVTMNDHADCFSVKPEVSGKHTRFQMKTSCSYTIGLMTELLHGNPNKQCVIRWIQKVQTSVSTESSRIHALCRVDGGVAKVALNLDSCDCPQGTTSFQSGGLPNVGR